MDPNTLMMVVLIVLVGGMLYLSSRTRKKQQAAQQQKMSAIMPGVRVTTIAGLQGTVSAVADDTIELEIAPGVRTTWLRAGRPRHPRSGRPGGRRRADQFAAGRRRRVRLVAPGRHQQEGPRLSWPIAAAVARLVSTPAVAPQRSDLLVGWRARSRARP